MSLQEQFCKEYYEKNKHYLNKEQLGIDIRFYYKEYARWLEKKLQNTASNSDKRTIGGQNDLLNK